MYDDDKFGSLKVYTLCVMLIRLEVWKSTGLQVYTLCVMIIRSEVRKFGRLHVVCDEVKFGSLKV